MPQVAWRGVPALRAIPAAADVAAHKPPGVLHYLLLPEGHHGQRASQAKDGAAVDQGVGGNVCGIVHWGDQLPWTTTYTRCVFVCVWWLAGGGRREGRERGFKNMLPPPPTFWFFFVFWGGWGGVGGGKGRERGVFCERQLA